MNLNPKILVIRQLALGDVILLTPIISQLYKDYGGNCEIDVLTHKPEVFKNNPYVNNVYTNETFTKVNSTYDRTLNLDLAYEKQPLLHITDAYSLYAFGTSNKLENKRTQLFSTVADQIKITQIYNNEINGAYLVIHMRHDTWPSRNLSSQSWKNIIDMLLKETTLKIIQVGSSHEFAFDHNPRLVNMLGRFSIHELKELIAGAKLYFGIDSGTLHIAATTNTPIVSLFTSAHHTLRMPLDRPESARFVAVAPRVDCYGCQAHIQPPITGVICHKGDPFSPPCKDAFDMGDISRAIKKAIISSEYLGESYLVQGIKQYESGNTKESELLFRKAILDNPEGRDERIYLSYALCRQGNYTDGLDEMAWVWKQRFGDQKNIFSEEKDLKNKRIVLCSDAGLGDSIQLIRYAPYLRERGAYVIAHVQPELVRLFENSKLVDEILSNLKLIPEHDVLIPIHNIMNAFCVTPPEFPKLKAQYLQAIPGDIIKFQKFFEGNNQRKVGVCWKGNPKIINDHRRSVSPEIILRLTHPDDLIVSLIPQDLIELKDSPYKDKIHRYQLNDVADTAALMTCLDHIITVDTMVAHLASALGKGVTMLARSGGCWRWGDEGDKTFWYPELRIIRQTAGESWQETIERFLAVPA